MDMDRRAIGVFDSGLGGLTAVREIRRILPGENIVYFGDTARVPYGSRSEEVLLKYARQDMRFLRSFDLKAIVIACGTVSTTCLATLQAENDIPLIGVVEPSCRKAAALEKHEKVGLIATAASIRSGAYEKTLAAMDDSICVRGKACPLFVPLVENGRVQRGDVVVETVARDYLRELKDWGAEALILGCTHYPLLTEVIGDYMGENVVLINSGAEVAAALKELLLRRDALSDAAAGEARFYCSDRVANFSALAELFLREKLQHEAEKIDIEQY